VRAALAMMAVIALAFVRPAGAACVGDCNGNGSVSINELIVGVNIALGTASSTACSAMDTNQDGRVTINELIAAVKSALDGCAAAPTATAASTVTPSEPMITVTGSCAAPGGRGGRGLKPCDDGTVVTAFRCDDRSHCLHQRDLTMIGATTVAAAGAWSMPVRRADASGALVFQADIATAVVYRALGFAPVGGLRSAGVTRGIDIAPVDITPVTEAAVQLLADNGFENFSDTGAQQVIAAVDQATIDVPFENVPPETAAAVALEAASSDATVMMVVETARNTPTPTETSTRTLTPTATATPTTSVTATASDTPTRSVTPTATPSTPAARFVDNGDGTITDTQTDLVWEKKVSADGSKDAPNLHDADNLYSWAGRCSFVNSILCQPNAAAATACAAGARGDQTGCDVCPPGLGTCDVDPSVLTTVWDGAAQLNAGSGFAGKTDWRVPTLAELESLIDRTRYPAAIDPAFNTPPFQSCNDILDPTCSATAFFGTAFYASADARDAGRVWTAFFLDGSTMYFEKATQGFYYTLRGVRGGRPTPSPTPRYVDNGDGTISDRHTGLIWEKKVSLDGNPNPADPHDADNEYLWGGACTGSAGKRCQPNLDALTTCVQTNRNHQPCDLCTAAANEGTCDASETVWTWVRALNASSFAGHADWRIPTIEELETLVDPSGTPLLIAPAFQLPTCSAGCGELADPTCSCTQPNIYWAATGVAGILSTHYAWQQDFGAVSNQFGAFYQDVNDAFPVRAVRGSMMLP
jgi:hypothetical protein